MFPNHATLRRSIPFHSQFSSGRTFSKLPPSSRSHSAANNLTRSSLISPKVSIMKINTKTATPIWGSPHSYQNENKFIPASAYDDQRQGEGRTVRFETVIVSTPVLASARLHSPENSSCQANKRVLTKDDVNELNSRLNSLYLGSPTKSSTNVSKATITTSPCKSTPVKREEKTVVKKEPKEHKVVVEEKVAVRPKRENVSLFSLGRYSLTIYDFKTNGFIEVLRSARLALKQQ